MKKQNEHIKYIRMYNKDPKSFIELRNKDLFSFLYNNESLRITLMEALIHIVRDFNNADYFEISVFVEECFDYVAISEVTYNTEVPEELITEFSTMIYDLLFSKENSSFRGDVVEFVTMYLIKNNEYKIYHEPYFYYKRKRLFKNAFSGSNCLIDLVVLNKRSHHIRLIECKANLDNQIRTLKKRKSPFKNKIKMMDMLEAHLKNFKNYEDENIEINKTLATLKCTIGKKHNKLQDYVVMNLFDEFRLYADNIVS